MQAGHQSDADIYIYDEIGFWGVTAKQFISDLNALGDITHINLHIIHRVAMSLKASPFLMR
ncbi:putative aTP-dependent Clp protease proteolytic subunit [Escherichia coli 2-427-07_S1_C3]|nr:putative aTP-dependent Clp protease proteolytic subunit [Escherichia coli 2-427-07_S1_C3]